MKLRTIGVATAAACLVIAGEASATVYRIDAAGVLISGSDPENIFQTGNSDLAGVAFDENITVDTSQGVYATDTHTPMGCCTSYFGTIFNTTNSFPVSATLSINGVDISDNGQKRGVATFISNEHIEQGPIYFDSQSESSVAGHAYSTSIDFSGIGFGDEASDPLLTGGDLLFLNSDFSVGSASGESGFLSAPFTVEVLDPNGGPSQTVSAAPEPSAWALMFAGVAGIGLVLRRARARGSEMKVVARDA